MQFEKLITQPPGSTGVLLQGSVYGPSGHGRMLRDVMGLANAAGKGARYIVFGVARKETGQLNYAKLGEKELREIDTYKAVVSRFIEPELRIECVMGNAYGHMLAALLINGRDNPPYIIRMDAGDDLRRGDCWVREGGACRPAQRSDYDRMYGSASRIQAPDVQRFVQFGFGLDPAQDSLIIPLPDLSQSPSTLAAKRLRKEIDAKRAIESAELEDSRLARLVHARLYGNDQRFDSHGLDTLIQRYDAVLEEYREADHYYYFEMRALKVAFCLRNITQSPLENVRVILTLPWAESFRVAEALVGPPGKAVGRKESELLGYPSVQRDKNVVRLTADFSSLEPGEITPLYEQSVRIAVKPELAHKKVAIRYKIRADGFATPCEGKLRITLMPAKAPDGDRNVSNKG